MTHKLTDPDLTKEPWSGRIQIEIGTLQATPDACRIRIYSSAPGGFTGDQICVLQRLFDLQPSQAVS